MCKVKIHLFELSAMFGFICALSVQLKSPTRLRDEAKLAAVEARGAPKLGVPLAISGVGRSRSAPVAISSARAEANL
jgi:hypothetical protein